MKRIVSFALAAAIAPFLFGFGEVQAAGLLQPSYPVNAPVSAPSWTGLYGGINGGYGGGTYDYAYIIGPSSTNLHGTASMNSSGGFGGGQIGYNYQFAPSWVAGIEADIEGSGIQSNLSGNSVFSIQGTNYQVGTLKAGTKLDYFGTLRGRLGFLVTPKTLVYGTGGWAYGKNTSALHLNILPSLCPGLCFSHSSSDTHNKSGWTVGGGVEYALTPHLSINTQYLYMDLGKTNIARGTLDLPIVGSVPASISEKTTVNTIKVGLNYRF